MHCFTIFLTLLASFFIALLQNVTAAPVNQQPLMARPSSSSRSRQRTRQKNHEGPRGYHIDPAPNTVGVLFGGPNDQDAVHVWLPLGRRMFTRDILTLPVHPHTARITTTIADTPERASNEFLDAIRCFAYFVRDPNVVMQSAEPENEQPRIVGFSKKDGLVRFGVSWGPFWRSWEGMEVESYMCS